MPKSGNVTIKLGPKEVKAILDRPVQKRSFDYAGSERAVAGKVYKAVAEKFTNVQAEMEEHIRARDICHGMRESDAWQTLRAGFYKERQVINQMYVELNVKESNALQQLVQQAFDKAGITGFVATGHGYCDAEKGGEA